MIINKQAKKYLEKVDKPTLKKFNKALVNISLNRGPIEPLKTIYRTRDMTNIYRYKMDHYRIIFQKTSNTEIIIKSITTKSDTKHRNTGCK